MKNILKEESVQYQIQYTKISFFVLIQTYKILYNIIDIVDFGTCVQDLNGHIG